MLVSCGKRMDEAIRERLGDHPKPTSSTLQSHVVFAFFAVQVEARLAVCEKSVDDLSEAGRDLPGQGRRTGRGCVGLSGTESSCACQGCWEQKVCGWGCLLFLGPGTFLHPVLRFSPSCAMSCSSGACMLFLQPAVRWRQRGCFTRQELHQAT